MEQRGRKQGQQLRLMVINKIGNQLEEQALVAIKSTNQDLKQNTKSATGRAPSAMEEVTKGTIYWTDRWAKTSGETASRSFRAAGSRCCAALAAERWLQPHFHLSALRLSCGFNAEGQHILFFKRVINS